MSERERLIELLQNCHIHSRTLGDMFYIWAGTDLGWGLILSGKMSNNRYSVSSIGKTVFLTKEQAEKALKGGATNE